jgi:hypothetical protein
MKDGYDCIWIVPAQPGVHPEVCGHEKHVSDCEGEICDLYVPKQPHATSPPDRKMGDSDGLQCHVGECQCGHLAIYRIVRGYFGDAIPPSLLEEMDNALVCADKDCRDEAGADGLVCLVCDGLGPCIGWKSGEDPE